MRGTRHKMRKAVLLAIYSWLMDGDSPHDVLADSLNTANVGEDDCKRARELLQNTMDRRDTLQERLSGALKHWSLDRVGQIELSVLYLALEELNSFPDIPTEVVIDEALRLAKQFSGEDSAHFVNGILDALAPSIRGKTG